MARKLISEDNKQELSVNTATKPNIAEVKVVTKKHPFEGVTAGDLINYRRERTRKILDWVNSHPFFKYTAMCKSIGINEGNFCTMLSAKENAQLPLQLIAKIEPVLEKYGYRI